MKWVTGYTIERKNELKQQWHRWFAWYPVVVGETVLGRKIKIWLEYVERMGSISYDWDGNNYWRYEYRTIVDCKEGSSE